ncbi:MAG: AsmA-like C-terminal region-containing protein, partial [Cytophagales bacterium]
IAQAALTKSNLVSGITSLAKLDGADNVTFKDALMSASITDGKLNVKPFKAKFGDYPATISGSTGLDKSINYDLKLMVPAGKLGSQLSGLLNPSGNPNSEVPIPITLGGTMTSPKFTLNMKEQKEQVKEAVKNVAQEKATEAVQNLVKDSPAKDVINNVLGGGAKADSTKKDSTKTDPIKDALQNKLNNLFKKKKN